MQSLSLRSTYFHHCCGLAGNTTLTSAAGAKTSLTSCGANTSSLRHRCWCQYPITMLVPYCSGANTSIIAAGASIPITAAGASIAITVTRRMLPSATGASTASPSSVDASMSVKTAAVVILHLVLACTACIDCACTFSTVVKAAAPSSVPKPPSTVLFF